jgi:hypothetical protein
VGPIHRPWWLSCGSALTTDLTGPWHLPKQGVSAGFNCGRLTRRTVVPITARSALAAATTRSPPTARPDADVTERLVLPVIPNHQHRGAAVVHRLDRIKAGLRRITLVITWAVGGPYAFGASPRESSAVVRRPACCGCDLPALAAACAWLWPSRSRTPRCLGPRTEMPIRCPLARTLRIEGSIGRDIQHATT